MIGQIVGHYKITARLGAGGMGEVYLAEDTNLRRSVALKFLLAEQSSNADARKRFRREAHALASLNHPNVVTVHDVAEHEGRPYLAMEYIEGRPLSESTPDGGWPVAEAIDIAICIAAGLESAHQRGVVHRDLKPGNVLLTTNRKIKITDFGLAHVSGTSTLTRTGTMLGTISYMAPEQIRGESVDPRADIFSFGVLLYELLCGRRPFTGDNEAVVLYELLNTRPVPLSEQRDDLPFGLEAVVERALSKTVSDRFQTMTEVLASLEAVREVVKTADPEHTSPSRLRKMRSPLIYGTMAVLAVGIIATILFQVISGWRSSGSEEQTLVVLPFRNVGDPDQEYFADGLTVELITKIGRIHGLAVISQTSAMAYKNTKHTSAQIGAELGAEYLLEGTVRWQRSGDTSEKVRVTTRLIYAADETVLWDDSYDAQLADIFQIQTDVAEQVAAALNVAIFEGEKELIAGGGTEVLVAYDYYLRANDYFSRGSHEEDITIAINLYEQAVAADTSYAAAHARLSWCYSRRYWFGFDHAGTSLDHALRAVERALALDPTLPEAHIALGYYYYWGSRDYDKALEEFTTARKGQPNSSEILEAVGYVLRRRGEFEDCLRNLRRSLTLDPRSSFKAYEIGNTYYRLRRWEEAEQFFDRAIALAPDRAAAYSLKARLQVYRNGQTTAAARILDQAATLIPGNVLSDDKTWVAVLAGDFQKASDYTTIIAGDTTSYFLERAQIFGLMKDELRETAYYDSARIDLESFLEEEPGASFFHRYLGIVYAGLNRDEDAVREAEFALSLLPLAKDPFHGGPSNLEALARVYTSVGRIDDALSSLEMLLSTPAGLISPAYLRIAPEFTALRGNDRFELLLKTQADSDAM